MMYRSLGAAALLTIAIAAPVQDAAAQDPVGGAILGGAAGGPLRDGCEPLRLISIVPLLLAGDTVCANAPAVATTSPPAAANTCLRIIME
jgi:hypothetical protein